MNQTDPKTGHILVVDDDEDVLQAARLFLKQHVAEVQTETDPATIPDLLQNESFDVVLLDMNFTEDVEKGEEGFYWLDHILRIDSSIAVVLITAYGDVEKAVRAVKEGATDFVLKPWQNEKLLATISSALRLSESRREISDLRSRQKEIYANIDQNYSDIIGKSPAMMKVFETIEKVAGTEANVLITGENGTGKEVVARAVHRRSKRSDGVFVNVDLGAIQESLFESELFGHTKGAFTDAKEDRPGRFEVASGGTLFLDEIGNIPLSLQAKLLSVIQNRQVTRVGFNKSRDVDIRLISATNMPIEHMVEERKFRQDLLYRINTISLELPPLRERKEDIPLLADHFLENYRKKYNRKIKSISEPALNKLKSYSWPGNVRELQHAVERAVIMSEHNVLQSEDFLLMKQSKSDGDGGGDRLSFGNLNLDNVEKTVIRKALKESSSNITKAAEKLELSRASLYRRMEKYGL